MIMVVMMVLVLVITMVVVMVVVMMPLMVDGDAIDGDVADDDGGPLNLPKYIFFNSRSAPVWILCQFICNRLVARIALKPQYNDNFDPRPLGKAI